MTSTPDAEHLHTAKKNAEHAEDHAAKATAAWKKNLEEYNETIQNFSQVNFSQVTPDELRSKLTELGHADIKRVLANTKSELARTELELAQHQHQQKGVPQSDNAEEEAGAVASSGLNETVGAADGTDGADKTTEAEVETTEAEAEKEVAGAEEEDRSDEMDADDLKQTAAAADEEKDVDGAEAEEEAGAVASSAVDETTDAEAKAEVADTEKNKDGADDEEASETSSSEDGSEEDEDEEDA